MDWVFMQQFFTSVRLILGKLQDKLALHEEKLAALASRVLHRIKTWSSNLAQLGRQKMSHMWVALKEFAVHKLRKQTPPPPASAGAEMVFMEEFPSETPSPVTPQTPSVDALASQPLHSTTKSDVRVKQQPKKAPQENNIGTNTGKNFLVVIASMVIAGIVFILLSWVTPIESSTTTLTVIVLLGTIGVLVFGLAAMRRWREVSSRNRQKSVEVTTTTTTTTPPQPAQVPTRKVRDPELWKTVRVVAIAGAVVAILFIISNGARYDGGIQGIINRSGLAGLGRVQAEAMPIATRPSTTRVAPLPWEAVRDIIADCESGLRDANGRPIPGSARQFDKATGEVLIGINTDLSVDRGKWQINSVHDKEIAEREINIMTEAGNEEFARILYERNYLKDWSSSQECWGPQVQALRGGEVGVGSFIVTTTKGWSQVYRFPAGKTVEIRAVETGSGFELMPEGHGRSYTFTAERSDVVPGNIIATSIRSHGDVPAKVQFRIF